MKIHIDSLTFNCIIGLLDFERENQQQVIVELEASYDYSDGVFINYADIVSDIKSELIEKKYKLLEDALLGIKIRIYSNYQQIEKLKLKISKPNILDDCSVALSNNWEF